MLLRPLCSVALMGHVPRNCLPCGDCLTQRLAQIGCRKAFFFAGIGRRQRSAIGAEPDIGKLDSRISARRRSAAALISAISVRSRLATVDGIAVERKQAIYRAPRRRCGPPGSRGRSWDQQSPVRAPMLTSGLRRGFWRQEVLVEQPLLGGNARDFAQWPVPYLKLWRRPTCRA